MWNDLKSDRQMKKTQWHQTLHVNRSWSLQPKPINNNIDASNEVTLGLQLHDYNIQIKFESLKQIMHSVCS